MMKSSKIDSYFEMILYAKGLDFSIYILYKKQYFFSFFIKSIP